MARTPTRVERLEADLEAARRQIQVLEGQLTGQQQLHLRQQEDHRFREAVIEQAAEGVCVCHDVPEEPFVRFTVWNRRMTEITGYQMEEINRLGWYQSLYHDPTIQQRARARMGRMREGDNLCFERWEIVRADGAARAIAISTSVLTAADGSVHVLGLMHDLTEHEDLVKQRWLARTDELTSVRNRRGFEEDARLLLGLARRQRQVITLGYLDLKGFKALNDERGHVAGDRALQAIGQTLRDAVRSTDVVGRTGGDEFVIVLPGTDAAGAKVFFTCLAARLTDLARTRGLDLGFSLGVVTFLDDVPDLVEALREVDAAMYRAKESGKTAVVYERYGQRQAQ